MVKGFAKAGCQKQEPGISQAAVMESQRTGAPLHLKKVKNQAKFWNNIFSHWTVGTVGL